jgi:hypothetical protein
MTEEVTKMSQIHDAKFSMPVTHTSPLSKKDTAPQTQAPAPEPAADAADATISLSSQAQSLLAEESDPGKKETKQGDGEWKNHGQMVSYAAKNGIHGQDLSQISKGETEGLTKADMDRIGNGELTLQELLDEKAKAAEEAAKKEAETPVTTTAPTPAPAPAPDAQATAVALADGQAQEQATDCETKII